MWPVPCVTEGTIEVVVTVRNRILCPLRTSGERALRRSDCSKFLPGTFIGTLLEPGFVTSGLQHVLLKAFFSQITVRPAKSPTGATTMIGIDCPCDLDGTSRLVCRSLRRREEAGVLSFELSAWVVAPLVLHGCHAGGSPRIAPQMRRVVAHGSKW